MKLVQKVVEELELSPEYMQEIGGLTITKVVERLNNGELTSKALLAALCYRTGTIGVDLCYVTETNF